MALELVLRARRGLSLGRLDEAETLAREAAADPASAADAWHIVGLAHLRRGDLAHAERALRQAIARDGQVAAYHGDLGNVLQDRGDLKGAVAAYTRALRLNPRYAEAWNDLGTARYARGEYESAVECYLRALRLRPQHVVAHANLGAVYRKLGLLTQARRALQRELVLRLKERLAAFWRRRGPDLGSAAGLARMARAQLDAGNPRHAEAIARRALEIDARHSGALGALAEACLRLGRADDALAAARTDLHRSDAWLHQARARALTALGRHEEAVRAYEEALRLQPRSAAAAAELGELRLARGDAEGAEPLFERALALQPDDAGLYVALGEARHRQQKLAEAEAAYRAALARDPRHVAGQVRLSELLREAGRLDEALATAQAAVAADDEAAAAHFALGMAFKARGQGDAAITAFRRAIELEPQRAQALQQLALVLREEDRLEDAERQLRAARALRPDDPNIASDLGIVLADLMRYDEALACFDRALELAPHAASALNRKALLLDHLGERENARALFERTLRLAPEDPHARYNFGLHHLKYGEFAAGWDGYEARRSFDTYIGKHRRFPLPDWQEEPIAGRTLLVLPEQGLGDEIMFGSCLPDVSARAKHVIVECDPKLEALFRRSFPACTVVSRQRTIENDWINRVTPRPELQVAAGSLARRFRRRAEDFPAHRGFLRADASAVAAWRARLAALGPGRKVGLSWRGGVAYTGKKRRSLSLEALLPVLRLPGVEFVNLQYTDVREEVRELQKRHGVRLHHWQEAIDDYDQTAALVCALEGVLTVCTAIVHLTGSLGRPGLVMVPFGADWRYGGEGERMPWYPAIRLVRQRRIGGWDEVLAEVSRRVSAGAWE